MFEYKKYKTKFRRFIKRIKTRIKHVQKKADRGVNRFLKGLFDRLSRIKFIRSATNPLYKRVVKPYPRLSALALCLVIIVSTVGPVATEYFKSNRYELNEYAHTLLGESNPDLAKKITYNSKEKLYQFNKEGKEGSPKEGNPLEMLQSKVGNEGEEDEQQYSVDIAEDLSKGVTYYDNKMQLSFKVVPQFQTMLGKKQDGHLIYPLTGGINGQVAYTTEGKGLKENVILYESPGDSLTTSYKLELPESLEAKLNSETGDLEIYSADPALFGKITYGTSDDQSKVEQARNSSPKTFLTFVIPAPVVLGLNGDDQSTVSSVKSKFEFSNDILTVKSTGLDKAAYPLSIDPTISIDSTSDFQTGNMEDSNSTVDSGSLKRTKLTGGSTGAWSSTTSFSSTTYYHASVAYNGYIYVTTSNQVRRAPINANGTIGSWTSSSLPITRHDHTSAVYNGYLYVIGGSSSSVSYDTVYYAPINSNGSLGSWNSTTSFITPRENHSSAVYNGYMYVMGGANSVSTSGLNDVQYAPINANGTLGTWNSTTDLVSNFAHQETVVYNGYIYSIGGRDNGVSTPDILFAKINDDGTLGDWEWSLYALNSPRYYFSASVHNGYLYIFGGRSSGGDLSDVQYAPIEVNGQLGGWSTTSQFSGNRYGHSTIAYNGYLYVLGGASGYSDVQYSKIDPPGVLSAYNTTTPFASARMQPAVVAYNSFLYILGGWTGGGGTPLPTAVQYAYIYDNGTVGGWNTTTSFTGGRHGLSAVVQDGRVYIMGGTSNSSVEWKNDVQYATFNSNGTLSAWSPTASLNVGRHGHASVAYNGYIYVTGGYASSSTNPTTSVERGAISSSGSISNWTSVQALNVGVAYHSAVEYSGTIFVIGGATSPSATTDIVRKSTIDSSGLLSSWTSEANYMPQTRYDHTAVVSEGYLYVIGGRDTSLPSGSFLNSTIYTKINSSGIEGWSTTSNFSTPRQGLRATVYDNHVFILGGYTPTTSVFFNDVQSARINNGGGGTIYDNGISSTSFTTARNRHATVAYRGWLYILGGYNGSGGLNDVQKASINPDGTLGAWSATSSFATARHSLTAAVYNGYMYVLGGTGPSGALNDVQKASINPDGTLGAWSATSSFAQGRTGHSSVVANGYMYVLGGSDGGPFTQPYYYNGLEQTYVVPAGVTSVRAEVIGADGQQGDYYLNPGYGGYVVADIPVTPGETLYLQVGSTDGYNGGGAGAGGYPSNGGGASDIRKGGNGLGNRVVVAGGGGGGGGGTYQGYGYNTEGGIGGDLTAAADGAQEVVGGGTLCQPGLGATNTAGGAGGIDPQSTGGDGSNGALGVGGAGGDNGTGVTGGGGGGGYYGGGGGSIFANYFGCGGGGGTSYVGSGVTLVDEYAGYNGGGDGYIGISYGSGASSDVQYAPINSDGTLGAWQSTTSLSSPSLGHASVAHNGYIYVLGGQVGNSNQVRYAPVNSNGTLGAWVGTNRFHVGRYGSTAVVYNGYMYIMGGYNSSLGFRRDTQYASINSNGSLGEWSWGRFPLVYGRANDAGNGGAVYDGRLYMTGGNAGALQNTTEYTTLKGIPRKTAYSKVIDLKTNSLITNIGYTGTLAGGLDAIKYRTAGSNGVFGTLGNAQGFSCSATGLNRYIQVFLEIDDTGAGVFRDEPGTSYYSSLDSVIVSTKPLAAPTENRLRHGAFFNNQVLQPFNTNNTHCD